MPPLMPPPASQIEKPLMWWSRPLPWAIGVRPNSPPQTTSVSSSMPRCFRSLISAAHGWSTSSAMTCDVVLDVAVVVPVAVVELDEPHAALGQPAGQQAVRRERAVGRPSCRTGRAIFFGSSARSISSGHAGLHPERHLVLADARGDLRIVDRRVLHAGSASATASITSLLLVRRRRPAGCVR